MLAARIKTGFIERPAVTIIAAQQIQQSEIPARFRVFRGKRQYSPVGLNGLERSTQIFEQIAQVVMGFNMRGMCGQNVLEQAKGFVEIALLMAVDREIVANIRVVGPDSQGSAKAVFCVGESP